MHYRFLAVLAFVAVIAQSCLSAAEDPLESRETVAAVRTVEAHWAQAFVSGDADYLNGLLDPDYVSVSTKGIARSKADIIVLAEKLAAEKRGNTTLPPPVPAISLRGDAAIVKYTDLTQTSVDVFHYSNGKWHAWYSQHTAILEPKATH